MELKAGMQGSAALRVAESDSARAQGSGSIGVFSTPRMVALMEQAACAAIAPALGAGQTSVGAWIEVEHLAATPLGMEVKAEAVLESVEGRVLHFKLSARDEGGEIGRGRHRRVLVETARFMAKTEARRG